MPRIERHRPVSAPAAPPVEPAAAGAAASPASAAPAGTYRRARPASAPPTAEAALQPLIERRRRRAAAAAARPELAITPATHPQRFTAGGQLKWKTPPPGATVVPNTSGSGEWIEKWANPRTGEMVYNYTAAFMEQQSLHKFKSNAEFGRKLGRVRDSVRADLAAGGRDQVLAAAVACIDEAYFRIGNTESAEDHDHYGLTTLQARHLHFEGEKAVFDYVGKSGQAQRRVVADPAVVSVLRDLKSACKGDGDLLFRHEGEVISNQDVNQYLDPFGVTAKQFRTYHATRLCRESLLGLGTVPEAGREKAVTGVVERVAQQLGHTPAVCRGSYIDPVVIEAFLAGRLR